MTACSRVTIKLILTATFACRVVSCQLQLHSAALNSATKGTQVGRQQVPERLHEFDGSDAKDDAKHADRVLKI